MFRCSLRLASGNQNIYKGLLPIYIMENTMNDILNMIVNYIESAGFFVTWNLRKYNIALLILLFTIFTNILIYRSERRKRR